MNADQLGDRNNCNQPQVQSSLAEDAPHKEITEKIIKAAFAVSNVLGCGFLEKVYENALVIELREAELQTTTQVPLRVQYRGQTVGDYAADLIVEDAVLVEIKATLEHNAVYEAQTINYLRATGLPVGLLLNFGRPKVTVRRFVKSKGKLKDAPAAPTGDGGNCCS
jgi:GxxExxY protein